MTLAYDDFRRTIRETDPLTQARTFVYDANNNLSTSTDALLQTTTYTWKYGQLLHTIKDNTNNVYSFSRNALGQYTDATAPAVKYHYDYDSSHRLISLSDSRANKMLTYAYSPGGLLNTLKDSDGNRTDYIYDPNGRMTGIWAPNDDLVSLNYDNGGRLIEKWLPNGEDSQYLYNADNTLQSLTNKRGLSVISSHGYTYDALGNRQTQAETINASTINYTYGYDPLNRLIQVQNGNAAQQENYSYDPIGNRLTKQVNATTPVVTAYVYDVANQLKEIRQGSATGTLLASLTYDANGNMKTRSDTGLNLTYDALNRMTQATVGGQTSSYIYDALGRRLQKTVGGVATNYLYTGQNLLAEYGANWGLPTAQYVHGPGIDDVVIRATSTASQYYHQDGLNSVIAITNTAGTTDATQRFDAWGNKIASTGTAPHFGYTGREPDETGLIYYRARYYDPSLGRFTQRDPIGFNGGINMYTYVINNPINANDPNGEDCIATGTVVRCVASYPGAPAVSFQRPEGWPDVINANSEYYHQYDIPVNAGSINSGRLMEGIANNPTPGSPGPATAEGTANNATPSPFTNEINSPVKSYATQDLNTGNPVVVNVTLPGHELYPGYVVRYVTITPEGNIVNNVGEGTASIQSKDSFWGYWFADSIDNVWVNQTQSIIDKISNQTSGNSDSSSASGGFVLY